MKTVRYTVLLLCLLAGLHSSASAQITVFPSYYEDFENGDGGWSASGTNSSWELGEPSGWELSGAYSGSNAWATGLYSSYNTNELSYLTSPQFDFSCLTDDPTLRFAQAYWLEGNWDFYWIEISVNGGAWTKLGSAGSGDNWYNTWYDYNTDSDIDVFCGYYDYSYGWDISGHTLTGTAGSSNVRIRFVLDSDTSYEEDGVYIDDISIEASSTTLPAVVLSSPNNNMTNAPLDITLSWDSQNCADWYEVEVSTTNDFSKIVYSEGKFTELSYDLIGLDYETQYFWRVRAVKDGNPGQWSSTRNFTTIPSPPDSPVLLSPIDGTLNLNPTSVALQWQSQPKASSYRIQLSTDPTFTGGIIVDESVSGGAKDVSTLLVYGTRYYWRVNASNISGTSGWSPVWNFATLLPLPVLAAPANNEQGLELPLQLSWQGIAGVSTYNLQIASDAGFTTILFDGNINGTTYSSTTLDLDAQYFWRVRAVGNGGIVSAFTPSRTFSTIVPTPILSLPFSGEVDKATSVDLVWKENPKPAQYQVQVSTSLIFTQKDILLDKIINGQTLNIMDLPHNTLVYWRVRAVTTDKGNSNWSDAYSFMTIVAPTQNLLPADNSRSLSFPIEFQWQSVGEQVSYDIEIAEDKNFKNIVVREIVGNLSTIQFSNYHGLTYNQTYWWRVRPRSRSGQDISWSPSYTFTTKIGSATVISPMDKSTDQSLRSRYMWSTVSGAEQYSLVVSKSSDLSNPIISVDNVSNTEYSSLAELELSTTYYWQVRSISSSNGSSDSPVWSFTTASAKVASAPDLIMPAANAVVAAGRIELQWSSVEGATSYDVEVSDNQTFSTIAYSGAGQTASSWSIDVTESSRTLYWRVRSVNSAGTGAWSSWRRFSTSASALLAPELLSPPRNGVRIEPTVIFVWNEVSNAVSYHIQVSTDANFGTLVYSKNKLIGLSTLPLNLNSSMTYYWRVLSENEQGESVWSPVWSFTTSSGTTSISEDVSANTIRVTPHPVVGSIGLTIDREGIYEVSLLGMGGEEVQNLGKAFVGHQDYSTDGLGSGMYILRISDGTTLRHIPIVITR
jgi:hypothetical protein